MRVLGPIGSPIVSLVSTLVMVDRRPTVVVLLAYYPFFSSLSVGPSSLSFHLSELEGLTCLAS